MIVFSITTGGAIGLLLRYYIGAVNFISNLSFPLSRLIINATGSFLMIVFFGVFTTFSTFSIEVLDLFQKDQHLVFLIYIFGSVVTCLLSVYVGFCFNKIASL